MSNEKTRLYQEALEMQRRIRNDAGLFEDETVWLSSDEEDALADARYEVDMSFGELKRSLDV